MVECEQQRRKLGTNGDKLGTNGDKRGTNSGQNGDKLGTNRGQKSEKRFRNDFIHINISNSDDL
jgi:hypothetical protein